MFVDSLRGTRLDIETPWKFSIYLINYGSLFSFTFDQLTASLLEKMLREIVDNFLQKGMKK